jgi:hypothetical protein
MLSKTLHNSKLNLDLGKNEIGLGGIDRWLGSFESGDETTILRARLVGGEKQRFSGESTGGPAVKRDGQSLGAEFLAEPPGEGGRVERFLSHHISPGATVAAPANVDLETYTWPLTVFLGEQ